MNSTETPATFASLGLDPLVEQAVRDIGYEAPSQIQAEAIPPLLAGRDLLGQAQTGTGKTAAFALPLLSRLDRVVMSPQVLVLAPTRELALQVAEAFRAYARNFPDFHILPVYGGQGMDQQLRALKRGVHVVVGTPGRVMDHVKRRTLDTTHLRALVLDEADEMLRMGFAEDLDEILRALPAPRQTALFSATLPAGIRRIAEGHLKDPVRIQIRASTATVATVEQSYWLTTGTHKLDALTRILEAEDFDAVLVFVRTKNATVELAEKLEARGYRTDALNGDMNQAAREKTVARLRSGALDVLVATDVAARGLDVQRISHVINYDMPYDAEAYVHRIGRTARAGRTGRAILFVAPREKRMLRVIETATRQRISELRLPTRALVEARRLEKFRTELTEALADEARLQEGRSLVEEIRRGQELEADDLAAGLAVLLSESHSAGRSRTQGTPSASSNRALQSDRNQSSRPPQRERPPRDRRANRTEGRGTPLQDDAGAHPLKPKKIARARREDDLVMVPYRLEVGRAHGVLPKNIVGAITNEAGLEGRHIEDLQIHDTYSTVLLPEGMPREILRHLKKVRVAAQELRIQPLDEVPRPPRTETARARGPHSDHHRPARPRAERPRQAGAAPNRPRLNRPHGGQRPPGAQGASGRRDRPPGRRPPAPAKQKRQSFTTGRPKRKIKIKRKPKVPE